MFEPKSINDIASRLADAVPLGLSNLKADMGKNFQAILQNTLATLDLVSREEFEVQKAVLAKTSSKLEALEKRVSILEQNNSK